MRIVICNNRYFRSSGPETYMFGLQEALERRGHAVHPFAARLPENAPAPDADLFVDAFGASGKYLYKDYVDQLPLPQKVLAGLETIYSVRARRSFAALLERVRPDVVYTLNITNMLTPSIVYEAARHGVPVVSFCADYGLTCAAYGFFRDGHACFDCRASLRHALTHRCVQNSLAVTGLRVAAIQLHRQLGYTRQIQAFVAPSRFMADDLERLGVAAEKIHFLLTPMWALDRVADVSGARSGSVPTVAYVGRIAPEKGLEFLLQAWAKLRVDARLMIIGPDHAGHRQWLSDRLGPEAFKGVEFVGPRYGDELYQLVASADLVVVPSLSPDNSPNVVAEALALSKPVVATNMGGIPDQVDSNCAILVNPWDLRALSAGLERLLTDAPLRQRMGDEARRRALSVFQPKEHVDQLLELFEQVIARRHSAVGQPSKD